MDEKQYDLESISPGVSYLKDGYIDYAKEVIIGRALADLYDGLKTVNRRIIYTLFRDKVTSFRKSATVCGDVLSLHPHGDDAVYQAMVLMTQNNGSFAFPLIDGSGSFGGVYKIDKPAAKRYTEVKIHPNAKEYFNELDGIEMVPNFDATEMEPTVLPVPFPAVLVNSTSGIAVGFGSNIPSFNFNEVCDLVIEYINDGECHTVIAPDFVTGGSYVRNEKELQKLMKAGVASLKLRAKTIVDGKRIICTEVPYGKTTQRLIKQINSLETNLIRNAYDADDFSKFAKFTVDCASKNKVDEAMYLILRKTDMQYSYHANMTMTLNGVPRTLGVWKVIEEWVSWRRKVLVTAYEKRITNLRSEFREAEAFMRIVGSYDRKMELVRIIADSGKAEGAKYIRENFTRDEVPADLIEFCAGRSLPSYHTGGKYAGIYNNAMAQINSIQSDIDNVDDVIKAQMVALKAKYGEALARKTEVTTKDYEFIEGEEPKEKFIDTSFCIYEINNNFVRKTKYPSSDKQEYSISGVASDTLVLVDNRGRVLRLYGQDLPYSSGDLGMYLPRYFGFEEDEDYRIVYAGLLDGNELMIMYRDGNIGFLDTSEWVGNSRSVKVIQKGISTTSAPTVGLVIPYNEVPSMIFAMDLEGRVGWVLRDEIKHKDRTARTRAFELNNKVMLHSYAMLDGGIGSMWLTNMDRYHGRMRFLDAVEDFRGDVNEFKPLTVF